jgi:hypothetical protein
MGIIGKVAAVGTFAVAALAGTAGLAHAQTVDCTGNKVIDHAPYTCTDSRVITGITFHITLNVDATGQATVDYVMSPVQAADVPIALHSYTDINLGPKDFVTGVIPAGQTTAQLVVPRIECGQLDIKTVKVTPGDTSGNIAGPRVTWGAVCQVVPTTTTTTTAPPTSVSPTSVSPTSVVPTSVSPTIPSTGAGGVVPWTWSLPIFGLAAGLIALSRFRRPAQ